MIFDSTEKAQAAVKLLQNNKHFDKLSTSDKIVAPVVVYPDIVSN